MNQKTQTSPIQQAKESVRLFDFFSQMFGKAVRVGDTIRWSTCPACGKSRSRNHKLSIMGVNARYWTCHKCNEHGDVIQAAVFVFGLGEREHLKAARMLLKQEIPASRYEIQDASEVSEPQRNEALEWCLERIFEVTKGVKNPDVANYLLNVRKIPFNILAQAIEDGVVRTLPSNPGDAIDLLVRTCGQVKLKESGLWKDGSRAPGIAFRPLVFFLPEFRSAEFRRLSEDNKIVEGPQVMRSNRLSEQGPKAIRYGESEMPWHFKAGNREDICAFTEGAIDMWSLGAMGFQGDVYGIPGSKTFLKWNDSWLRKLGIEGKKCFVCFDNDASSDKNAGQDYAQVLAKKIAENGGVPIIRAPDVNMDVNAMWVKKVLETGG